MYGPTHFKNNEKNQDTLDKEVLLRAMGYTVISVNYSDWDDKVENERKAVLTSLVDPLLQQRADYTQRCI